MRYSAPAAHNWSALAFWRRPDCDPIAATTPYRCTAALLRVSLWLVDGWRPIVPALFEIEAGRITADRAVA